MSLYDSKTYMTDLFESAHSVPSIEKLAGSSILVTGAAGLLGSYVVDILLEYNRIGNSDITIYALDIDSDRLHDRFAPVATDKIHFIEHNVNNVPEFDFPVDYIIHAASNAFPASFNEDPVGTIMSNVLGVKYLLDYGVSHHAHRLLFVSSGEVYGQGDLSIEAFPEDYSGYVDPVEPRSCYPNSKRTAETLCTSYTKQFALDTVMVRPCHSYGPNATSKDNRANVQFINSAMAGEDIIMKSSGSQMRSYAYVADTASAILTVLINGQSCNAYNIANPDSRITIADFAKMAAAQTGVRVIFTEPDAIAKAEASPIAKQVLDSRKLQSLGWKGRFSAADGIAHTIAVLKEIK